MSMRVRDLKVYSLAKEYKDLFFDLSEKIIDFYESSPENTPPRYDKANVRSYWAQHLALLTNLDFFVLNAIFSGEAPVDIKTLKFLAINTFVDFDVFRRKGFF